MADAKLRLDGIGKVWGRLAALADISLTVGAGQFVSLLGPSGCGKTTLLRLIAGSLTPDQGRIFLDGADITHVPTHRRNMGMVFQSFALFPHLSVAENVAFPLAVRGVPAVAQRTRVAEAPPRQLSGGQQQRVGLARAIVYRPTVLLLDEPLSNLDASLREEMRIEIGQVTRRLGITAIYVTHDQREALALSDEIAVMRSGRVVQMGTPEEIYGRPADAFVAGFVGYANALPVTLEGVERQVARARLADGTPLAVPPTGLAGAAVAFMHAGDVVLRDGPADGSAPPGNTLICTVAEVAFMGEQMDYVLQHASGFMLKARVAAGGVVRPRGAVVMAELPAARFVVVRP
jgi:ABC-type Fe3+/spermidine/putrescine transport system ATPase subunit